MRKRNSKRSKRKKTYSKKKTYKRKSKSKSKRKKRTITKKPIIKYPKKSASSLRVGTIKKTMDGNVWVVKKINNIKKWCKYIDDKYNKKEMENITDNLKSLIL